MQNFDAPGRYDVTIKGPYWEQSGNEGDLKMAAILPGTCTINGEERGGYGRLYFSDTLIQGGNNAGRTLTEVNMETLHRLGLPIDADGYINPTDLDMLDGAPASFVVDWDEYKGQKSLKVQFVNAPGRGKLEPTEVQKIWSAIRPANGVSEGGSRVTKTREPAAETPEDDEVPF